MAVRYAAPATIAFAITFALFLTMQMLISGGAPKPADDISVRGLDFVRLKRDESIKNKVREKPKKVDLTKPPPPSAPPVADSQTRELTAIAKVDMPDFNVGDIGFGEGAWTGGGGGTTDVVPLVRVNPQYPARAAARGIEGWVHLKFTVTPQGTTSDIVVVDADPRGYFESSAKSAVKKYKYKPREEDGVAIARPGVELVLSFELEK